MLDYSILEDNELQKLSASGDRAAEEQLALRYSRLVKICARPLFLAGADSEDLIQEGMFGLLAAIRQYDPSLNTQFKTYAELCIKRRLRSAVRSALRLKHAPLNSGIPLDSLLSDESQIAQSAYTELFRQSPEEQILARENKEELQISFQKRLSKLEKQVLDSYLEGSSYSEIALLLGKDVKSVDNAVQRIRRKLAQDLNHGDISIS